MLNPDARRPDGNFLYNAKKRESIRKQLAELAKDHNEKAVRDLDELGVMLKELGPQGEKIVQQYAHIESPSKRLHCYKIGIGVLKQSIQEQTKYKEIPVEIGTFVTSEDYLNMPLKPHTDEPGEIYPEILKELKKACERPYLEHVLTGGIGSAKTTVALILLCYELYKVSCLRDPHREFSLIKSDEIVFVFQSLNAAHAKTVDYGRFKAMVTNCKYFQKFFMFDKHVDSELRFPNRIIVRPISGNATGAIGQNVIGGLIDEINFMKITDKSKQSNDSGTYDQAWENYNALVRRRESRFMKKGRIFGILCLVSSKRYPGEFTDVKIKEAKTNPNIFIYDKRTWEIHPPGKFLGTFFKIFKGDATRKPRILEEKEKLSPEDQELTMDIPTEYQRSFEKDLLGSMRDIAGVSTWALQPFILDIERVKKCFSSEIEFVLSENECDFSSQQLFIIPENIKRPEEPRFVHLDLAMTGDCAGLACGYVPGFIKVERDEGIVETLPLVIFDFFLRIVPPRNSEIQFAKIRSLIRKLTQTGLPIKWVSADLFQAVDTLQLLQRQGYKVGIQSMDKTMDPYDLTKDAIMDGRVLGPEHEVCYMEMISLERDLKKGKIDHGNIYGKDVSDAYAGVVYGLTTRREVWTKHGIPLTHVPATIVNKTNKNANSIDKRNQQPQGDTE